MLKGTIFITNDIEVVYQTPMDGTVKIICMDEDMKIPENNPNIIPGTCLLPPIDAKIAEADGNEQLYDAIYNEYLFAPFQQQYVAALVTFLYRGGNLLIYLHEDYTSTLAKFVQHMYLRYGIKIGIIGAKTPQEYQFYYDLRYIPTWLNIMYRANLISIFEYLKMFPIDADLTADKGCLNKLLDELRPYANTIQEQINSILQYHKGLVQKPNLTMAISAI